MPATQSPDDLTRILDRLAGEEIAQLQVLGINSLKSVAPAPSDLVGRTVTATTAANRIVTLEAGDLLARVDLQRTGRLKWLERAVAAKFSDPSLPTLRLILASGGGLDFVEPAKTKRIAVTIRSA